MAKQDDYTRYTIRVPTPLYERLKESAGNKSVNAEIIDRLEQSYILHERLIPATERLMANQAQSEGLAQEMIGFYRGQLEAVNELFDAVSDGDMVIDKEVVDLIRKKRRKPRPTE